MRGLQRLFGRFAVVLAVLTAALVFAASALAAANISVTFVRHAESQANADGIINTQVPGPDITNPVGTQQAVGIAAALAGNGYDGIYASDMVRTQQTAEPLAGQLGKSVTVLPGLHEISAGIYEGSSEDSGLGRLGYALSPLLWTLGARGVPIPGSTDPDGNAFQARVNAAMQVIYDSGDTNAVAFSHGATIMFWTMMNVDNPDLGLLLTHQLGNTGVVVVHGNPEDGWKLVSWDGVAVDPDPSFVTKLFVNVRDLVTTPQAAAYAVSQALKSGDLIGAASQFVRGAVATLWAPVKFGISVVGDVIDLVHDVFTPSSVAPEEATTPAAASVRTLAAAPLPDADQVRVAAAPEKVADDDEPRAASGGTDMSATPTTQPESAAAAEDDTPAAQETSTPDAGDADESEAADDGTVAIGDTVTPEPDEVGAEHAAQTGPDDATDTGAAPAVTTDTGAALAASDRGDEGQKNAA